MKGRPIPASTGVTGQTGSRMMSLGRMSDAQRHRAGLPRVRNLTSAGDGWFRVTDEAGGTARLDLYGEVGFFDSSAAEFNARLAGLKADRLEVHIASPGGDVFDGIAILNMLRTHPKRVTTVVDSLAASAASFIAMAGDEVVVMPNSEMMIHDAHGLCLGNAADMAEMGGLLDRASDNIASVYAAKTGKPATYWRGLMKGEKWFNADEAVQAGLADRVGALARGALDPAAVGNAVASAVREAFSPRRPAVVSVADAERIAAGLRDVFQDMHRRLEGGR